MATMPHGSSNRQLCQRRTISQWEPSGLDSYCPMALWLCHSSRYHDGNPGCRPCLPSVESANIHRSSYWTMQETHRK